MQLISFVYNCFIYKLVKMVTFIVQTKAEQLVYNCIKCFLYFTVRLRSCGLWLSKSNYSLAYKE